MTHCDITVSHTPLDQQPLGASIETALTTNIHVYQFIQIIHVVGTQMPPSSSTKW